MAESREVVLANIPGHPGGATVSGYEECVQCDGFVFNIRNDIEPRQSSGRGLLSGTSKFDGCGLVFPARGMATATLSGAAAAGECVGDIKITVLSMAGGQPAVSAEFDLRDAVVADFEIFQDQDGVLQTKAKFLASQINVVANKLGPHGEEGSSERGWNFEKAEAA